MSSSVVGDAAAPRGHLKIRREILAQHDPRAVPAFFAAEFVDDRLTIAERKPRPILLALLARPYHPTEPAGLAVTLTSAIGLPTAYCN